RSRPASAAGGSSGAMKTADTRPTQIQVGAGAPGQRRRGPRASRAIARNPASAGPGVAPFPSVVLADTEGLHARSSRTPWPSAAPPQDQIALLAAASVGYGKVTPPSWNRSNGHYGLFSGAQGGAENSGQQRKTTTNSDQQPPLTTIL